MIFQGLFNILDLYFKEIDLFYNNIDQYFREKINSSFMNISINESNITLKLEELTNFIIEIFKEIGFDVKDIENEFLDPFLEIKKEEIAQITSIIELYETKIAPIIFEIFLEKFVDYLVDVDVAPLMLKLKSEGFLTIEFIMELRNLKTLIEKSLRETNKILKV